MRNCFFLFFLLLAATPVFSASPVSFPRDTIRISQDLAEVKMRDLQKIAQRRFTLKERMVIKMVRKMEKRKFRPASGYTEADLSFLAAVSLLVFFGVLQLLINSSSVIGWAGPVGLVVIPLLGIAALWFGLKSKKKIGGNFKNGFGIIVGGGVVILTIIVLISALTM